MNAIGDLYYENEPSFAIITSYYNPSNYKTRKDNYDKFIAVLDKSKIRHLVVECVFPNQNFSLPVNNVIRMTSSSVLWQRERLVNLAMTFLEKSIKYVAWVDCDLLFYNPFWINETVSLLLKYPVVQLFDQCIKLPKGVEQYDGDGKISASFASIVTKKSSVLGPYSNEKHGTSGFAWAFRRDVIEGCGLYEYAIVGGADDYMAHAMFGDFESPCLKSKMNGNSFIRNHYLEWAKKFYDAIGGNIGVVPGSILHLWHGDLKNRQYFERHKVLNCLGFNPYEDILAIPGMPLEWSKNTSSELKNWVINYFSERAEDG